MKRSTSYLFYLLLLCFSLTQYSAAAANSVLENAKRQLALLDSSTEENRVLRDIYLLTIDTYSEISETEDNIESFKRSLKNLPEKTKQLQQQLANEQQQTTFNVEQKSLAELELELTELQSTELELKQNRNQIDNEINVYSKKPVKLREDLTQLKLRQTQEVVTQLAAQRQLEDVLFSLNNLKTQAINLELLVIPLQIEHDRLRLSWTDAELVTLAKKIRVYQDTIQELRQSETDELLQKSNASEESKDNPAAISAIIQRNNNLSEQLRRSVANNTASVNQLRILEQQLSLLQQSYKVIQQQLQVGGNTFGIELKNFSQRFSAPSINNNTEEKISAIRLQNIELNQLKLDIAIDTIDTSTWSKPSLADLEDLQLTSLSLISNLQKAYTRELDELSKLSTVEEQIKQQLNQGHSLLTEYLLWLPSVPTIDLNWFAVFKNASKLQIHNTMTAVKELQLNASEQWLRWLLFAFALSILSINLVNYQRRHEKDWSRQIGNVVHDKFSRTLRILLLAPLITIPLPLFIFILVNKIIVIENSYTVFINNIFCLSLWMYLTFIYWLKRPYGLFISHLDISEEFCVRLKKLLPPLYVFGAPLSWLLMYFDNIASQELHSGLGRLVYICMALLAGSFWAALWKVSPHLSIGTAHISWWKNAKLWLASLVVIHAGLVVAGLFGYLFTGAVIMSVILAITTILFTIFIFYRLGVRWLLIAERNITFNKAKTRRNEILAAREKNEEVPPLEEDYLGIKSVSEQAIVLLKAICFGLIFITMWLFVKNYLPSLDILDKITLWNNNITTVSGVISESISLADVITSSFIIGITILAAYNLPGLLELLVLRHMDLTPGTGYAITTITRYILIIICVLAGASQIGVEWAKLQWLVAAMGVGLGFGLQEIVANFVSGIIILFEKPVRIGDTVTIGGVTGKVTKIKIRATTISDWDRKEVIIPNKTFVTDQLINWSLSDAITRVIINVGVAFRSDTDHVHKIILSCVQANARVLDDPAPEVFFTTFGKSTLDFELRFFVANLADRNPAIHEINQHINRAFVENDIRIAFPQMDIHLHRGKDKDKDKDKNLKLS